MARESRIGPSQASNRAPLRSSVLDVLRRGRHSEHVQRLRLPRRPSSVFVHGQTRSTAVLYSSSEKSRCSKLCRTDLIFDSSAGPKPGRFYSRFSTVSRAAPSLQRFAPFPSYSSALRATPLLRDFRHIIRKTMHRQRFGEMLLELVETHPRNLPHFQMAPSIVRAKRPGKCHVGSTRTVYRPGPPLVQKDNYSESSLGEDRHNRGNGRDGHSHKTRSGFLSEWDRANFAARLRTRNRSPLWYPHRQSGVIVDNRSVPVREN